MISLLLATGLINLRMDITLDIIIQGQSQACIIFKKVIKKLLKIINYECSECIYESIPGCP